MSRKFPFLFTCVPAFATRFFLCQEKELRQTAQSGLRQRFVSLLLNLVIVRNEAIFFKFWLKPNAFYLVEKRAKAHSIDIFQYIIPRNEESQLRLCQITF